VERSAKYLKKGLQTKSLQMIQTPKKKLKMGGEEQLKEGGK